MKHSFRNSLMLIMITLALLVSALGVTPAFADDETPPPPATEEPVQQEPTQPPVVETAPEMVATEPPVEATPVPEATEEVAPTEAAPVVEILTEVPENTDIVALDENDEPLSLTSQDAAEVLAESDPKWCPEGEFPNSANCSANFPTIAALLADMQANPVFYSQDGVIYFERAALTTFTTSFVLDDSAGSLAGAYDTLKAYNITLTGGWSGGSSTNFPGHSLFSGPDAFIQVGTDSLNPWIGNVTINNIQVGVSGVGGGVSANNSVTIYTSDGDITLNNVDVNQQAGNHYTAYLESDSGDIMVGPSLNLTSGANSVFDGNNASTEQNQGFYAATSTGTISISDTTFQQAFQPSTAYSNGATLSAPVITLTDVTAKGNDGSGIYVDGMGITLVNVFGGTYTNNKRYGIEVVNSILNEQSAPTCSGNLLTTSGNPCYNVDATAPSLTLPSDMTLEATSLAGAVATFAPSATDSVDGPVAVTCAPASGSTFALGTTPVDCSATDAAGNTANGSFNVTVVDTTAPSLSLPSDMTLEATDPAGALATFAPTATDIADATVSVTCDPVSGSFFPLGSSSVDCSATDDSGNTANGSFNVTVVDTTAPSLSLPSDMTIAATSPAGALATFAPSATDAVDGVVAVTCTPASGSVFPLSTTSVDCSASDGAGNTANGNFKVIVGDKGGPILNLPANISIVVNKLSRAVVTYSVSATDMIEGPVPISCSPVSGGVFPLGMTVVNCSAADSAGNTTHGSFQVTVDVVKLENSPEYSVIQQTQTQLPGALGQGNSFVSALKLEFLDPAAKTQNMEITLSFPISKNMKNSDLVVMFWDGLKWVVIPGGNVVDNYFVITVTQPGFYVLVSE